MGKVKIGLVQMSCSSDKEENLQKAMDKDKGSRGKRCADRLPAGIVHFSLFL